MEPAEQRGEVEAARSCRNHLAVDHEALALYREQRLDYLWEIAGKRPVVAAAQVDLVAVPERQASKTVPFRFVEVVALGQLTRQSREHRRDARSDHAQPLAGSAENSCSERRSQNRGRSAMAIKIKVATRSPSIAARSAATPPTNEPRICPSPRKTEYRPMTAPRSSGYASDMSANSPSAAGVAPANTNNPAPATSANGARNGISKPPLWLKARPASTSTAPPRMP